MRIKLLAVKVNDRAIACCPETGRPLIGTLQDKDKLKQLIKVLKETHEEYKTAKIIKLYETVL